ncbi:hypothetical protein [Candidatus Arsenophonus triatominarum]|uniref:hypothetical protein n=1 Tax=Candidatus Arsenophonus triatominarum TaxID=57911 RepID=UPI0007C57947|nr:hypothetical protein [Candidatus Arsenophonus triatominarum]
MWQVNNKAIIANEFQLNKSKLAMIARVFVCITKIQQDDFIKALKRGKLLAISFLSESERFLAMMAKEKEQCEIGIFAS